MSQVYSTEPSTSGRVTLETTAGPIDIQLWCKECPTTTQLFIQLCLDGYYNNMIFHRIMDNFLIQTGHIRKGDDPLKEEEDITTMKRKKEYFQTIDPNSSSNTSNTNSHEEDMFHQDRMRKRKLELNARIRFNHRGQLAMALPVEEEVDDGYNKMNPLMGQFFITLEEAPFLNQKHIIFGTVSGPTMFNAIRIGRTEVNEANDHRPVDMEISPPTVLSTVVHQYNHTNPSILSKTISPNLLYWTHNDTNNNNKTKKLSQKDEMKARRKKRKGKRDLNVLSFGNEIEEDDDGDDDNIKSSSSFVGIQSSHDVLVAATDDKNSFLQKQSDPHLISKISMEESQQKITSKTTKPTTTQESSQKSSRTNHKVTEESIHHQGEARDDDNNKLGKVNIMKNGLDTTQHKPVEQQQHFETARTNQNRDKSSKEKEDVSKKKKSELEMRREKYLKRSQNRQRVQKQKREDDLLANLASFRNKIRKKSGEDDDNKTYNDTDLAARMANRLDKSKLEEKKSIEEKNSGVVYHGQVLELDDDDPLPAGNWFETDFKCKKHTDHSSRNADTPSGGDGRNINDYVVVDYKKKKKHHSRSGSHRQHHRRHR